MAASEARSILERMDAAPTVITDEGWRTSPPVMAILREKGARAYHRHIRRQLTRVQAKKLAAEDPAKLMEAQAEGRLDRILAGG